jgi:hypothetical protein
MAMPIISGDLYHCMEEPMFTAPRTRTALAPIRIRLPALEIEIRMVRPKIQNRRWLMKRWLSLLTSLWFLLEIFAAKSVAVFSKPELTREVGPNSPVLREHQFRKDEAWRQRGPLA